MTITSQREELERELRRLSDELEELRTERDLFVRAVTVSPRAVLFFDEASRIFYANPTAEGMLALRKTHLEDPIYETPTCDFEQLDGTPIPRPECPLWRPIRTRQPVTGERIAAVWPDGRRLVLSVNAASHSGDGGTLLGAFAVVEDITDRLRTDELIREREELFRAAFEASEDGVFLCGIQGAVIDVNTAGCRMFGRLHEELLHSRPQQMIFAAQRSVAESFASAAAAGERFFGAQHIERPSGERFEAEVSGQPLTVRGRRLYLVRVRDVTIMRESHRALAASEALFRGIFEQTELAMGVLDLDGRLRRANAALCRLFGYSERELLKLRFTHLVHPEEISASAAIIQRLCRGEIESTQAIRRCVRADGTFFSCSLYGALVRDADGQALSIVGMMSDIRL